MDNNVRAFTDEGIRETARALLDSLRSEREEKVCSKIRLRPSSNSIPHEICEKRMLTTTI